MSETPGPNNSDLPELPPDFHRTFAEIMWGLESGEPVPVIELDLKSQRADALRLKSAEYAARAERKKAEFAKTGYIDTRVKKFTLDRLLSTGKLGWLEAIQAIRESGMLDEPEVREGLHTATVIREQSQTGNAVHVTPQKLDHTLQDIAFNAFNVIQLYAEGREQEVQAGTGLPSAPDIQ